MSVRETLLDPLVNRNPVTLQVLGICSALAITNALDTALVMGVSLTAVLVFSNTMISLIRRLIPNSLRIIIQVTIIASGVIVVDQVLRAYAPDTARTLSVFVGLIVTNCIVLGRAEAFAVPAPARAHERAGRPRQRAGVYGLGDRRGGLHPRAVRCTARRVRLPAPAATP